MKKILFKVQVVVLLFLLTFVSVNNVSAQKKDLPTKWEIMKTVIWELAKIKVPPVVGTPLSCLELIANDPSIYMEVGYGLGHIIHRERFLNWADYVPPGIPSGRKLNTIYKELHKAKIIDKYEHAAVANKMAGILPSTSEWKFEELPQKVQDKINAIYQITHSRNPIDFTKAMIKEIKLKYPQTGAITSQISKPLGLSKFRPYQAQGSFDYGPLITHLKGNALKSDPVQWHEVYTGTPSTNTLTLKVTEDGRVSGCGEVGHMIAEWEAKDAGMLMNHVCKFTFSGKAIGKDLKGQGEMKVLSYGYGELLSDGISGIPFSWWATRKDSKIDGKVEFEVDTSMRMILSFSAVTGVINSPTPSPSPQPQMHELKLVDFQGNPITKAKAIEHYEKIPSPLEER